LRPNVAVSSDAALQGRLESRPGTPAITGPTGMRRLVANGRVEALLYVPPTYRPEVAAPLAVMLHGAGGDAEHGASLLRDHADAHGLILVAPSSRAATWDLIVARYGRDVAAIDHVLGVVFDQYAIDPRRIALGGFSDGASYALSLGLGNGKLFSHLIAFSPGFAAYGTPAARPRIFVSHGTHDTVLPIDRCSRRLVVALEAGAFDVTYHEFDGPHTIPEPIAEAAIGWFLADPAEQPETPAELQRDGHAVSPRAAEPAA
jgi:predicted esterase